MTTNYSSYEWAVTQDLSKYAGKWISIVDRKIMAVGDTPSQVLEDTKLKTSKKPLLTKISNKLRILRV